MKVVTQIETATLGDIVIDQSEHQNTTNPQEQQSIIVELLYEVLFKAKAAYAIPDDMLDLGGFIPSRLRPREGNTSIVLNADNTLE
jgi:hypothetical protein